jgi:GTP-binding protein HflX
VQFFKRKILLTDTVGFIDRLPLKLVKAFHSTLEETILSNVIVLVVDLSESEEDIETKISCSLDTLQQIGATGIPLITAFNKIDLLKEDDLKRKTEYLKEQAPNPVHISALHGTNINSLKQQISLYLEDFIQASFSLPINDEAMSLVSHLFDRAHVKNIKYEDKVVNVVFKSIPWFADKVKGRVKELGGVFRNKGESDEVAESCCFKMGT